MGSEKTLATTWITSVDRLSPVSRRLLDRLALLAPDPIPECCSTFQFEAKPLNTTLTRPARASPTIR